MGNPTTAQEPSMEEILASIRQIISEDGEAPESEGAAEATAEEAETAGQTDDNLVEETAAPEVGGGDAQDDPEGGSEFDVSAESADSEPASEDFSEDVQLEESQSDEAPMSFDTMDAASHDAQPDDDDLVQTGPYESPFDTFHEKANTAEAEQDLIESRHDNHAADDATTADFASNDQSQHDGAAPQPSETLSSEPIEPETSETHSEMSESQTMTAPAPKPVEYSGDDKLISADAGASVANAFSALTHTILSQNARTLDDLVSDMLQPMLKEWLDENLPTLVERLVKQEIDRMARGGRG